MTTQQTTAAANIALVRASLDAFNAGEWICSDMATLHGQLTADDT